MEIAIIAILFIITIILCIYILMLDKQMKYYKIVSKNLSAMRVIQSMFEIMGANILANSKMNELNKVILDTYGSKYSTMAIFNGVSHDILATNIDDNYAEAITKITEENDFKSNAFKNVSKYLTTSQDKTLRYKSAIERNIKSCMFSPIYYGETYLGFWILEDDQVNAYDSMSKDELAKIKNNLGVFLENTLYQNIIETAENIDKQTGMFNNLYLYSKARQELVKTDTSSFVLICFNNIVDVNNEYTRNVGNILLTKAVNVIKELVGSETMCIRYSGARILLVSPNSTAETIHPTIERMLSRFKSDVIEIIDGKEVRLKSQMLIKTFKKQNNIEKEVDKMVSYIDNMQETDTIKII